MNSPQPSEPKPRIGILTISDRASRGEYEDLSGPAIEEVFREYIATDCDYQRVIVPDEIPDIVAALNKFADEGFALVGTTGSTGPAPRDIVPEAMQKVCGKMLPGFGELMRRASLDIGVPTAILSRQTAGLIGSTLVVNMPGKPSSIRVCLNAVFPAIPYCIELAGGAYLEGNGEVVKVFRPKKK
ncbi:MAG: molybdopterin adenylyltransferase [Planctomycetota bacterium]